MNIEQVGVKQSSTVVEDTYTVLVDGQSVTYKEFLNDKGKVIDTVLRWTESGEEIGDARMQEEIQNFLDEQDRLHTERDA